MTPEEHLDRLIEQREGDALLRLAASNAVAAHLATAAILAQLQALAVPPAFAARLEADMRARIRNLAAEPRQGIVSLHSQTPSGRRQRTGGRRSRHVLVRRP